MFVVEHTFEQRIWLQPSFFSIGDLQWGHFLELEAIQKTLAAASDFLVISSNSSLFTLNHEYIMKWNNKKTSGKTTVQKKNSLFYHNTTCMI